MKKLVLLLIMVCLVLVGASNSFASVTMKFPSGVTVHFDRDGDAVKPDASGNATVPADEIADYLRAGFTFYTDWLNEGATNLYFTEARATAALPMTTLGDVMYGGASGAVTRLAGNTAASKKFLSQTGTGTVSQAPAWAALIAGDIPDISATYLTAAQKGAASGVASLDGSSKVVQDPANATATPTASKIPIADGTGVLATGWIPDISATYLTAAQKAAASGVASLDGSSKVVQDPANATATPTASKIPIADGTGVLATGWIPDISATYLTAAQKAAASGVASLDGSSKVVQDPANATATPTASKIPIADGTGVLATGWIPDISATYLTAAQKGAASGVASLDGSSKVVQDPANATATPTAAKIPIADGTGVLATGWIPDISATYLTAAQKAAASGVASLDGSSKVVQDPANATATPTASKIPIANGSGNLNAWYTPTTPLTSYAEGTAYNLTGTPAQTVFGTTSPALTVSTAGTWAIRYRAHVKYTGSTFAANETATLKLRRTNNTPADLNNSSATAITNIVTTETGTLAWVEGEVIYTTANTDDIIQLWGSVSDVPSAGSLDVVEANIVAVATK